MSSSIPQISSLVDLEGGVINPTSRLFSTPHHPPSPQQELEDPYPSDHPSTSTNSWNSRPPGFSAARFLRLGDQPTDVHTPAMPLQLQEHQRGEEANLISTGPPASHRRSDGFNRDRPWSIVMVDSLSSSLLHIVRKVMGRTCAAPDKV